MPVSLPVFRNSSSYIKLHLLNQKFELISFRNCNLSNLPTGHLAYLEYNHEILKYILKYVIVCPMDIVHIPFALAYIFLAYTHLVAIQKLLDFIVYLITNWHSTSLKLTKWTFFIYLYAYHRKFQIKFISKKVKEIHLHNEPFTVENNLLTPTMKVKRNQCREYFKSIVEMMYNQSKWWKQQQLFVDY